MPMSSLELDLQACEGVRHGIVKDAHVDLPTARPAPPMQLSSVAVQLFNAFLCTVETKRRAASSPFKS